MTTQAFALRPVRLTDLPTLKRWRGLPEVQRHLRHPTTSWPQHLKWWWRIQHDPTCAVWAVTELGRLVGQVGWYYRKYNAAEVSVLVMMPWGKEDFPAEAEIVGTLLTAEARKAGLTTLYAEVLATAPLLRHTVFPPYPHSTITADTYSTIYRWSIA